MRKEEFYQEIYSRCDASLLNQDRTRTVLRFLRPFRFKRFLDIGCGDGGLTKLLAATVEASTVKGIEISEKGCAAARLQGVQCEVADLDSGQLPFEGEQFDFIFCGEIIEHVFDTDRLTAYLHRMLRPGGKILITTPNLASWHSRVSLALGYNPFVCSVSMQHSGAGKLFHKEMEGGTEHIRFFTLRSLVDLLECQGFRVQKSFGFMAISTQNMHAFLRSIESVFARIPSLATNIGVFAEKT